MNYTEFSDLYDKRLVTFVKLLAIRHGRGNDIALIDDMIQAARLGVMRMIERFDLSKGGNAWVFCRGTITREAYAEMRFKDTIFTRYAKRKWDQVESLENHIA